MMRSSILFFICVSLAVSIAFVPAPLHRFSRQIRRSMASSQKEPALINSLLTKAVSLSQMVMKENNKKNNSTSEGAEKRLKPAVLSFQASHTQAIVLDDFSTARAYLALPASNYSVLNSNLVSRNPDAENIFELRLPLGGLSTASAYSTGALPRLEVTLQTNVKVEPVPEKRTVTMTSGPIFFTPTATAKGIMNSSSPDADSQRTDELSAVFPEWLIWGGNDQDPKPTPKTGQKEDDIATSSLSRDVEQSEEGIKSSVQAGFELQLSWSDRPAPAVDSTPITADGPPITDSLKVQAKIKVWVDMNLPLRSDVSAAINFPLIRVLLEQAGRLTTAGILRTVSPAFSELLVKDHDRRRGVLPKADPRPGSGSGKVPLLSEYTDSFLL